MPVEFNGTNSFVDIESPTSLDDIEMSGATSGMTVSFWINPFSFGEGSLARIYSKGAASPLAQSGFMHIRVDNINVSSGIVLSKDHSIADLIAGSTNGSVVLNIWQHFMVVWTGTSNFSSVTVFKNGSSAATAVGQNGTGTKNSDSSLRFYIGNDSGATRTFNGRISELAIWNVQFGLFEAVLLSNSKIRGIPIQLNPSSLKGYWPLDDFSEGAATVGSGLIVDRSSNGNHGTPLNAIGRTEEVLSYP